MLTIHLRINDAASGKPTPVRLRISGPDGTTYAPFGRVSEFHTGRNEDVGGHIAIGRERWCSIDGACEVKLPSGVPLRIQATKGPEFEPLDETIALSAGKMALRFALRRWSHLADDGWISGDSRCHFLPPHAALLEAAAEDVAVVNLLACAQPVPSLDGNAYTSFPNLLAFSGQAAALEANGHLVAVNTLNAHPVLGKVALLHSHRIVFPTTFGGDEETDDWSVCDWCDQCHRKRGLAVWVDAFRPAGGLLGGEVLAAAILGKIDAIEVDALPRMQPLLPQLYRLWSAGMMVPLVGGSGKDSNAIALGTMRTYAKRSSPPAETGVPEYRAWIDAVRAGRTFVTNGPLLTLEIGESIAATARSFRAFERLEIVANGRVIAHDTASDEVPHSASCCAVPPQSGWVAVRAVGSDGAFAHTSPVRVGNPEAQVEVERQTSQGLTKLLDDTRDWIEQHGRFANPKAKQHLLDNCAAARTRLTGTSSG